MKRLKSLLISWEALLVILLLISVVIGSVLSPYFLSGFNFNALTSNTMEIAIMALPMTLIISQARLIYQLVRCWGFPVLCWGYSGRAAIPCGSR